MKHESKKDNKNIIFVSIFIATMMLFMLATVIYVTSQIANCSSAKKMKNICYKNELFMKDKKFA